MCLWQAMTKLRKIARLLFLCNVSRKKWVIWFFHAVKHESYLWIILWFLIWIDKHAQISQNSMFVMSLQYLKKRLEMKLIYCIHMKLIYWQTSKFATSWFQHLWHQSFLQGETISIDENDQAFSDYNISKKMLAIELFNKNTVNKILHVSENILVLPLHLCFIVMQNI